MRLDEWQKYIDSQFLEDEPEPIAAPRSPIDIAPLKTEDVKTEDVHSEHAFAPEPYKQVEQDTANLTSSQPPETAPNAIQNVLTLVVTAPPVPVLPANPKPPRIELLTPLPDPPADQSSSQEVTNRSRRRSQASGAAAYAPNTLNTAADLLSAPDPRPVVQPAGEPLFAPLTGMDSDIPEFHRYLPASHAAAQPAQPPSADDALVALSPPHAGVPSSSSEDKNNTLRATHAEVTALPPSPVSAPAAPPLPPSATFRTVEITAPEMDALTADYEDVLDPHATAHEMLPRPSKSRARHARNVRPDNTISGLSASELWAMVPRHVQTLLSLERMEEIEVAQSSYKRPFQEKRHELIERLLDPILSLEDTARLLNVCPTTVRRYTNKGILTYYRKEPERTARTETEASAETDKETRQRRFRLSDILTFLETQQAAIAADRQTERRRSRAETALNSDTPQGRSSAASNAATEDSVENAAENSVTFHPARDV